MRSLLSLTALAVACVGPVADACSCVAHRSQAEADRAGDDIFRETDLIVEATIGDVSAEYKTVCAAKRAADVGRKLSTDRPLQVHQVLKGTPPRELTLAGNKAEVHPQGCAVTVSSCDVGLPASGRTLLLLTRVDRRRYRMAGYCTLMAFRHSSRGAALFASLRGESAKRSSGNR